MAVSPAPLHEELPLVECGSFEYTVSLADLGITPLAAEVLTAGGPISFLDFEATGLEPGRDELIEAGAVRLDPGQNTARVFNSLLATNLTLTPFIIRLTGISQADVDTAPRASEVGRALDAFLGDAPVAAHNAAFERAFLMRAVAPRFRDHDYLDTFDLLSLSFPDAPNMKLDTFCIEKLGRTERHRALDDALDTLRIVGSMIDDTAHGTTALLNGLESLRDFCPNSGWLRLLPAMPRPKTVDAPLPASVLHADALPPVPFDRDAIAARLADTELVRTVLPNFEARPQQIELMHRVFDAFAREGSCDIVLSEAGTGVGKTLAYLAVAIPFARSSRTKVIVSTSGKMLQTQLLEKDIPDATRLMGYPDLRFTTMKGRANYLCHRRMDAFLAEHRGGRDSMGAALISAFDRNTRHGEVDRLPSVLMHRLPDLEKFQREVVSSEAAECSRQSCETTSADCRFREARHRLDGAEVAVVNHDLLLRWPPDYPELDHLVLDEAHELVEKADRAYARSAEGIELVHRLEALVAESGSAPEPSSEDSSGGEQPSNAATTESTRELARRALSTIAAVGEEARKTLGESSQFQWQRDELVIPHEGPGPEWKELTSTATALAGMLKDLATRASREAEDDDSLESSISEVLSEAAFVLSEAFPQPSTDRYVFRIRGLSRSSTASWRLVATPVSPAADFEMHVLDRVQTVFATSATLSTGDDGTTSLRELELEQRAAGRLYLAPRVPSPFDYEKNLEVVFLTDTQNANHLVDNTARAVQTLATGLGGRTLGLFTSRDRMVRVANILDGNLQDEGYSVIAPVTGNADPHELVRTFVGTDRSILLGSRNFWQGVDIPGDACQAVVIEKLPFDVPGDPLLDRRGRLIEEDGGNGFLDFTLPRMLLRLQQMMGRLLRTPTDRGLIVLVESRADKRYFRRVVETVPEGARHHRIPQSELAGVVEGFRRRHG